MAKSFPPLSSLRSSPRCVTVRISVHNVFVPRNSDIYICGDCETLGEWNVTSARKLSDSEYPSWKIDLEFPTSSFPITYKYCFVSQSDPEQVTWEPGPNRYLEVGSEILPTTSLVLLQEDYYLTDSFKGAGVVLPIFSLKSQDSIGIGEFSDLPLLMDWAASCGIKLVQILPVNDTLVKADYQDSYPYK